MAILQAHTVWRGHVKLLMSVLGIGYVATSALLAELPEPGQLSHPTLADPGRGRALQLRQ